MGQAPYGKKMDFAPTLTDSEVIDFCRNGYLMLPGVVPDEINKEVVNYLERKDNSYEPTPMMEESFFVDGVLMNSEAAGAIRSLLGHDFTLPLIISNHRGQLPFDKPQTWHRDGGTIYTPALEYLQVFYYPEECTDAMGPTVLLPGSHFMRNKAPMMAHLGSIQGTVSTAAPAGTIFLTVYGIWHRRARATSGPTGKSMYRNLLKYNYWRTTPPQRDWLKQNEIDFNTINFNPEAGVFEQFQGALAAARMFAWLCGAENEYKKRGGQNWPIATTVRDGVNQEGTPKSLANSQESLQ